jgi:hypothetical protein
MDGTEIRVYGHQEHSAYNGFFYQAAIWTKARSLLTTHP